MPKRKYQVSVIEKHLYEYVVFAESEDDITMPLLEEEGEVEYDDVIDQTIDLITPTDEMEDDDA